MQAVAFKGDSPMKSNYVLHVYRAPSGQVSARLFEGQVELFGVAGCASIADAQAAVRDVGYEVDHVLEDSSFSILKLE